MDQRKLFNLPGLAEMSYGLQRYLKPEGDGLGCPHAHSLVYGAEDDGGKGMCCRGRSGPVASTELCWSRNQDTFLAHGSSFALKPDRRITLMGHLNAHQHRLLQSQAKGKPQS